MPEKTASTPAVAGKRLGYLAAAAALVSVAVLALSAAPLGAAGGPAAALPGETPGPALASALNPPAVDRAAKIPEKYRVWLEDEVFYIITPREKSVFLALTTDRERDLFIEAFWKHRDPTPGTDANEFKVEHYRRLEYANKRFRGYGKPGWKTDRGKIYVLLGEPMSRREFNGQETYYAAQIWSYQGIHGFGLPEAFNLLFFQKNGGGDFILYNPGIHGPWDLIPSYKGTVGDYDSALYLIDLVEPELAQAAISLIPGETVLSFPSLSSAEMLHNIDLYAVKKVEDKYAQKFAEFKDVVDVEYSTNYIDSSALVKVFRDRLGTAWVHVALEPSALSMGEHEGRVYTSLDFNGILTDETGRTVYQFEKTIPFQLTGEQYARLRQRPMDFVKAFPVVPGKYRFSVILKNTVSKEFTSAETTIEVPDNRDRLEMSGLLLAFNAQPEPAARGIKPFVFGNVRFYGQPGNSFIASDALHVYFQLLHAPKDLTAGASVKYVILKDGQEQVASVQSLSKYGGGPDISETFPLTGFGPGYYALEVRLVGADGADLASRREEFVISPLLSLPRPWVPEEAPAGDAETQHILGLELLNTGDNQGAMERLRKALDQAPDAAEIRMDFARAALRLGRASEAAGALEPLLGRPDKSYDLVLLAGRALLDSGRPERAVAIFNEALASHGLSIDLLNGLGEAYERLGDPKEALAAYAKSLTIKAAQPDIKARVDALRK
jgi:GWxTD domain-containing protein